MVACVLITLYGRRIDYLDERLERTDRQNDDVGVCLRESLTDGPAVSNSVSHATAGVRFAKVVHLRVRPRNECSGRRPINKNSFLSQKTPDHGLVINSASGSYVFQRRNVGGIPALNSRRRWRMSVHNSERQARMTCPATYLPGF